MAGKTKIDGTNYTISGGKTRVNGTVYQIKGGKTMVNGTLYDISFGDNLISFTVYPLGMTMYAETFQAERGMTWGEFLENPAYCPEGIFDNYNGQVGFSANYEFGGLLLYVCGINDLGNPDPSLIGPGVMIGDKILSNEENQTRSQTYVGTF